MSYNTKKCERAKNKSDIKKIKKKRKCRWYV